MQVVSQQSNYVTVCRQDFCANYIGQELWLDALDWERASEWRAAPPEVWEVDGERAGTVQAAEPLTYVKLDGAGHMVSALLVTVKCMVLRAAAAWLRWSQLILARNAEHCKARRGHCSTPQSQTASDSVYFILIYARCVLNARQLQA